MIHTEYLSSSAGVTESTDHFELGTKEFYTLTYTHPYDYMSIWVN